MEAKKLNTTLDFKFEDGEVVKLTLAFYALYKLRNTDKKLYTRYNETMVEMSKSKYDEIDMITILYVAYVCALEEGKERISFDDFIMRCGNDRTQVMNAVKELTSPKKK